MYDLKEKIVIITGGARGIGFSTSKEILRAGAGAVTIVDIDEKGGVAAVQELKQKFGGGKAIFVRADVTKEEQFEEVFKKTLSAWKRVDVVINNAGISNDAQWEKEIDINVKSLVRGSLLALKYMNKNTGGRGGVIVNISSIVGLQDSVSAPIYSGTKHFVIGFTRSLGAPYHFERTGVKLIAICPGLTDTPLASALENSNANYFIPEIGEVVKKEFAGYVKQPAAKVAEGIITSIKEGSNGSIWVLEDNEDAYEIALPDRKTFKK